MQESDQFYSRSTKDTVVFINFCIENDDSTIAGCHLLELVVHVDDALLQFRAEDTYYNISVMHHYKIEE